MLHEYEAEEDPFTAMNVLKVLCWGIQAWEIDLKASTMKDALRRHLKLLKSSLSIITGLSFGCS